MATISFNAALDPRERTQDEDALTEVAQDANDTAEVDLDEESVETVRDEDDM